MSDPTLPPLRRREDPSKPNPFEALIEGGIFASRWLLLPLYIGLVAAQVAFAVVFGKEMLHMFSEIFSPNGLSVARILVMVLEMIDIIMVANLVVIVVIGGYATFVSKLDLAGHADRPAWLDHIDPGTLKTKLAGGLVGVSGIHLLQTFVNLSTGGSTQPFEMLIMQVVIHLAFVIGVVIMAWADLLAQRKVMMEHQQDREDAQSAGRP